MLRLILAAAHLLALGIGLGSVWARARALAAAARSPNDLDASRLRPVFEADNWWGVAAGLWLVTGLWRAIGGTEKTPSYYAHNVVFWAKMGLFVLILLLEAWPMTTLIRWRIALGRGARVAHGPRTAARLANISYAEAVLLIMMVGTAVAMARGYGARG